MFNICDYNSHYIKNLKDGNWHQQSLGMRYCKICMHISYVKLNVQILYFERLFGKVHVQRHYILCMIWKSPQILLKHMHICCKVAFLVQLLLAQNNCTGITIHKQVLTRLCIVQLFISFLQKNNFRQSFIYQTPAMMHFIQTNQFTTVKYKQVLKYVGNCSHKVCYNWQAIYANHISSSQVLSWQPRFNKSLIK